MGEEINKLKDVIDICKYHLSHPKYEIVMDTLKNILVQFEQKPVCESERMQGVDCPLCEDGAPHLHTPKPVCRECGGIGKITCEDDQNFAIKSQPCPDCFDESQHEPTCNVYNSFNMSPCDCQKPVCETCGGSGEVKTTVGERLLEGYNNDDIQKPLTQKKPCPACQKSADKTLLDKMTDVVCEAYNIPRTDNKPQLIELVECEDCSEFQQCKEYGTLRQPDCPKRAKVTLTKEKLIQAHKHIVNESFNDLQLQTIKSHPISVGANAFFDSEALADIKNMLKDGQYHFSAVSVEFLVDTIDRQAKEIEEIKKYSDLQSENAINKSKQVITLATENASLKAALQKIATWRPIQVEYSEEDFSIKTAEQALKETENGNS